MDEASSLTWFSRMVAVVSRDCAPVVGFAVANGAGVGGPTPRSAALAGQPTKILSGECCILSTTERLLPVFGPELLIASTAGAAPAAPVGYTPTLNQRQACRSWRLGQPQRAAGRHRLGQPYTWGYLFGIPRCS
jgi:hypothetical protein